MAITITCDECHKELLWDWADEALLTLEDEGLLLLFPHECEEEEW